MVYTTLPPSALTSCHLPLRGRQGGFAAHRVDNNFADQNLKLPIVHFALFCYNNKKCYYNGCVSVKYGIWNVGNPEVGAVNALVTGGYAPLTAMVLAARGFRNTTEAKAHLSCDCPMPDPFL